MKVRELLEELKNVDPEKEVYMIYTETGCCSHCQNTEEVPVDCVTMATVAEYTIQNSKRVAVSKPVVMLSEY